MPITVALTEGERRGEEGVILQVSSQVGSGDTLRSPAQLEQKLIALAFRCLTGYGISGESR